MPDSGWIAVDAMGGDDGLAVMLAGVARARHQFEGMRFLLVGDEAAIREGLKAHPNLSQHSEIVHAPEVVGVERQADPGDSSCQEDVDGHRDRPGQTGSPPPLRCRRGIPAH